MTRSPEIEKLAAALAAAQGEFKPVPKTKTAKIQTRNGGEYSYKYADLADVLGMALPILSKHEMAFTQSAQTLSNGQIRLTSTLLHVSGQWLSNELDLIKEDNGSYIKSLGSTITYGRRYEAGTMLGVVTEEDDDGAGADQTEGQAKRAAHESAKGKPAKAEEPPKAPPAGNGKPKDPARQALVDRIVVAISSTLYTAQERKFYSAEVRGTATDKLPTLAKEVEEELEKRKAKAKTAGAEAAPTAQAAPEPQAAAEEASPAPEAMAEAS